MYGNDALVGRARRRWLRNFMETVQINQVPDAY